MNSLVKNYTTLFNQYQKAENEEEVKILLHMFEFLYDNRRQIDELEIFKITMMIKARDFYDEIEKVSYPVHPELKEKFKSSIKKFVLTSCTSL